MDNGRPLKIDLSRADIARAEVRGPDPHAPERFDGFEAQDTPERRRLRQEYRIDDAVVGETDEFRRILKLRHWVNSQWPIDDAQNFDGDAFAILEKAKTGAGFHCSHCMVVLHDVLSAFGFVARKLGVDRNHEDLGRSAHHGVNEVWSNDHAKWVLLDAKYDIHFEREGVPLSALEAHEAVRADGGQGVTKVMGIEREPKPMDNPERPEGTIRSYWWVSYHTHPNAFPRADWQHGSKLVVYDSPAFRQSPWYRQNKAGLVEHWAYGADAFIRTADRHEIDWTPSVPFLRARQASPDELSVEIHSATPDFQEHRVRSNGAAWEASTDGCIVWKLDRPTNTLEVRARNTFGVEGPVVTATAEM